MGQARVDPERIRISYRDHIRAPRYVTIFSNFGALRPMTTSHRHRVDFISPRRRNYDLPKKAGDVFAIERTLRGLTRFINQCITEKVPEFHFCIYKRKDKRHLKFFFITYFAKQFLLFH